MQEYKIPLTPFKGELVWRLIKLCWLSIVLLFQSKKIKIYLSIALGLTLAFQLELLAQRLYHIMHINPGFHPGLFTVGPLRGPK